MTAQPNPKVFAKAPTMKQRLNAGLVKMAVEGLSVRAIYLTEKDHNRLDKESRWKGMKTSVLSYEGYEIRRGETSAIYTIHGVRRSIPTLTSRSRVRA